MRYDPCDPSGAAAEADALAPPVPSVLSAGCSRTSLAHGAALAIRESGNGRILGIAAESPAGDPAGKAREFIAEAVRIQGRLYRRGGFSILVPETIQALPATPLGSDAG